MIFVKRFVALCVSLALMLTLVTPALALPDTEGPVIGAVSPLSAQYTVPQTFGVVVSDASAVTSCTLRVSSIYDTPMLETSTPGVWQVEYTFETLRSANSIRAVCEDEYGNSTNGPSRIISVADAPIVVPDGDSESDSGDPATVDATDWTAGDVVAASPVLIKTVCPGGEDFTHPCRTVYFLDNAGDRHAFPNERAYFTWYSDWNNIHLVTNAVMASYPLSRNVRYHPGTKMVKFISVPTVYAVGQWGLLRPIDSEDVAEELYGENWNQQIDDLSDVFITNYIIGESIGSHGTFNVEGQRSSVTSINDNLGIDAAPLP